MDIYALLLPSLLLLEVIVILGLYRYVLRGWILDKFEEKVVEDEGEWLVRIFSPLVEATCDSVIDNVPDAIIKVLKNELLASQGTLTRMHKGNPNDEQEVGMEMAEMLLKELGLKSPSALLTLRAGKAMLGMIEGQKKGTGSGTSTASLPVGNELLKGIFK